MRSSTLWRVWMTASLVAWVVLSMSSSRWSTAWSNGTGCPGAGVKPGEGAAATGVAPTGACIFLSVHSRRPSPTPVPGPGVGLNLERS